jgi:hypothetical protein
MTHALRFPTVVFFRKEITMRDFLTILMLASTAVISAAEPGDWWNPEWQFRTTVERPAPYRDEAVRPVEVAVDFARLLDQAGIAGKLDPDSLRVVERDANGSSCEVPSVWRTEFNARLGVEQGYLSWFAQPQPGRVGRAEIYFDVEQRGLTSPRYDRGELPLENLLANAGFEQMAGDTPAGWTVEPAALVRLDRFEHTTGLQSLKVVVDKSTPAGISRDVAISQRVDVRRFAGQEVVFQCDLLAERAAYGAPVAIAIEQFRGDGSRIRENAVDPRWLNIELAQGQLVQFCEWGRFSPQAATANVLIRMRCSVRDADTGQVVDGPDSYFAVWLDRVVLRPGERWPWPARTHGGFIPGALTVAPVNRGFEFTGLRRVAFNGASEATLVAGYDDPDPRSVHWGLAAGTLEFWCRPSWNAEDGREHTFFDAVAYGHRLQSRLRKLDADGKNQLEFAIADAGGTLRSVRAVAPFRAGAWHHVAVTWDFPNAQLALFFDGEPIGRNGPSGAVWPSSLVSKGTTRGIGIAEQDSRSMPMQAFIGGDADCQPQRGAEAILDEFRISDCPRYAEQFKPARKEFALDGHTRALWHFENDANGIHDSDDGFVRGHLACELPRQQETAVLDVFAGGRVERRTVLVAPHPDESLFAANRAENRLTVTRPFAGLPDPRFVEYRLCQTERVISSPDDDFTVSVGGDWQPLMESLTFELADTADATTAIPRWRANDNVVPFSVQDLNATLAPDVSDESQRAFEVFQYALATTNYFDAHYCETLPERHRPRVSYTLVKALNIYPFDQCGPLNHTLRKLFLTAGISSQNAPGTHHQFEQAFYQGGWRLFDLSPRVYWLNRDNTTVAGRPDFEDDLYLKLRQGSSVQSALPGRRESFGLSTPERPHAMEFPLRPGEQVRFGWQNEGRWFELTEDRQPIPLSKVPPYFGNGTIDFQPVRGSEAMEADNLDFIRQSEGGQMLRAKKPQQAASLVYRLRCPYILSAASAQGQWSAARRGAIRASLSFDNGRTWAEVWRNTELHGAWNLDIGSQIAARYAYWLRIDFEPDGNATLSDFHVRTTFVVSPLSLPETLRLGDNRIQVAAETRPVPVKAVCRWYERHASDLGVDVEGIGYYLDGDRSCRNVLVAAPGGDVTLELTLTGRDCSAEIFLEHLPTGWTVTPRRQTVKRAANQPPTRSQFVLRPASTSSLAPVGLEIVLRENGRDRRVPIQVLVAPAALACEAESGKTAGDGAVVRHSPADSGGQIVEFGQVATLTFEARAVQSGEHALWLRARWEPGSSTQLDLAVDGSPARKMSAAAMIGFTDWDDPRRAHTKMFAHYGEAYGHWSWYRIGDIDLTAGPHRLTLGARDGAHLDALVLLPATPQYDRAAMNLFQNWNYDCRAAE